MYHLKSYNFVNLSSPQETKLITQLLSFSFFYEKRKTIKNKLKFTRKIKKTS